MECPCRRGCSNGGRVYPKVHWYFLLLTNLPSLRVYIRMRSLNPSCVSQKLLVRSLLQLVLTDACTDVNYSSTLVYPPVPLFSKSAEPPDLFFMWSCQFDGRARLEAAMTFGDYSSTQELERKGRSVSAEDMLPRVSGKLAHGSIS